MQPKVHNEKFLALVKRQAGVKHFDMEGYKALAASGEPFGRLGGCSRGQRMGGGARGGCDPPGKGLIERDIEKTVPDANTKLVYCGGGFEAHWLRTRCIRWVM